MYLNFNYPWSMSLILTTINRGNGYESWQDSSLDVFLAIQFGFDPEVKLKASRMCAQSSNP